MIPTNDSLHFLYTLFNEKYYESPEKYIRTSELSDIVTKYITPDFSIMESGLWTMVNVKDANFPAQGWKIHISATFSNYKEILEIVTKYSVECKLPFKFSGDSKLFHIINEKSVSRTLAGKFITIYPSDEENFLRHIENLFQLLKSFQGPYILSDRRYKDCKVLYYRYGNLKYQTKMNSRGEVESYLIAPSGEVVEDNRKPFWNLPSWIVDPLEHLQMQSKDDGPLLVNRYKIIKPLSYSSSGGVYEALDISSDQTVIIKEARPYTGQNFKDNSHAIDRLKNEFKKLTILRDLNVTPQPIDFFEVWEHAFLVQEKVDGKSLGNYIINNNPLTRGYDNKEVAYIYSSDLPDIWKKIAEYIGKVNKQGVIINDISINNILVQKNEKGRIFIKLIDFEAAYTPESEMKIDLHTPGFRLTKSESSNAFEREVERVGLVYLATLFPFNNLYELDSKKISLVIDMLENDLEIPEYLFNILKGIFNKTINSFDEILHFLTLKKAPKEGTKYHTIYTNQLQSDKLSSTILKSVDFKRTDRLFPSDPNVFFTNPLSILYGSYGILYSLSINNEKIIKEQSFQQSLTWSATMMDRYDLPPGLYSGLAGIAWALCHLGKINESKDILDKANIETTNDFADLFYGLAGIGMSNLYLYKNCYEEKYLSQAKFIGDQLISSCLRDEQGNLYWKNPQNQAFFGYAQGSSGIALFLLYLYLESQEIKYLETGIKALEHDLFNMKENQDGRISIKRGTKSNPSFVESPYIYDGLAGIGTVALRYYVATNIEKYKNITNTIAESLNFKYTYHASLYRGISGIGNFLIDHYQCTGNLRSRKQAEKISYNLNLYAIQSDENIEFPGEQLLRISHDLGTGGAGVLLFIKRMNDIENYSSFDFLLDKYYFSLNNQATNQV